MNEEMLVKNGWVKRSILDEPRLSEAVEFYREIGFEVKLAEVGQGDPEDCTICLEGCNNRYRVIYTRQTSGNKTGKESF